MTNLPLGDVSECLDNGELCIDIGRLVKETHDGLDHLGGGLFELAMLLREHLDVLVHEFPIAGVFA